jgi:hypothetical protein
MMLPAGASTAPTEQTSEDATHSDTYCANLGPSVDDTSARPACQTCGHGGRTGQSPGPRQSPLFLSERPVSAMNF